MESRIIGEKIYHYGNLQVRENDLGDDRHSYDVLVKYTNRTLITICCTGEKHSAEVASVLKRAADIRVEQVII